MFLIPTNTSNIILSYWLENQMCWQYNCNKNYQLFSYSLKTFILLADRSNKYDELDVKRIKYA